MKLTLLRKRLRRQIAYRYLIYTATTLFSAAIILSAMLLFFNYRNQQNQLQAKVTGQADFLSAIIPEDVYFNDFLTLETLVRQTSQDQDIVYVVIVDTKERPLTRYLNREDPRILTALETGGSTNILELIEIVSKQSDLVEVRSPVSTEGLQLAEVRVGYSLNSIEKQVLDSFFVTLLSVIALMILLVIVTVFLFNSQIGVRLQEVADLAGKVAEGQLDISVDVRYDDEIGQLKRSMNIMASRLLQNANERQIAEKKLQLSEAKNRSIVTTAVDGIITVNESGIIDSFNQAAVDMFGYTPDEVIGQNVKTIMPEPDHSDHDKYMHNYLSTGVKKIIGVGRDVTGRRKNGEKFPVYLSISEINVEGQHLFTGILRDITEQKEAEVEIRDQRDFALQVMNTMGQGLTVTNAEGNFEYVNPAYAQMLGFKSEDLIGKSLFDHFIDDAILEKAFDDRKKGLATTYETQLRNSSGEAVYVLVTGAPLRREGEIVGAIAVITDLTERQQAEKALQESEARNRLIVDNALDAVVVIDENGNVTAWNPQAETIFGWAAVEAVGQSLGTMIIPHAMRSAHRQGIKHYYETGEGPVLNKRFEITALHRDGHEFPVELAIAPTQVGNKTHFSAFIRDISLRKQAEETLENARDQALQTSRLKSDFLATMSHEIRTPMNGIIGMSEILLDTELDEDQRDYTSIIVSEAQALLLIINDILDYSKIEAGKILLETIDFDVSGLVEGVLDSFALRARDKDLDLLAYIDPRLQTQVQGDPGRLRQVLVNLIDNAIKFTPEGEIELRIELVEKSEDDLFVQFEVRDTGIGMSAEVLENLFETFMQADSTSTRKYGGTGLGLAISHRLVNLMGGDIHVSSQEKVGSTFSFSVPFKTSDFLLTEPLSQPLSLSRLKVLAVLGSTTRQEILKLYLSYWGGQVDFAKNRGQAIAILQNALNQKVPYQIFLVDDGVEDAESFAFSRLIHNIQNSTTSALIYLYAFDRGEVARNALKNNYWQTLSKPIKPSQLQAILRSFLNEDEMMLHASSSPEIEEEKTFSASASGEVVLIVEDDLANQKVAFQQLEKLGYQAEVAMNGVEALEAINRNPARYALILMDLQMPEMNGYTAARSIRQLEGTWGKRIPIVAMTANVVQEDVEKAMLAGMDDYLIKPVTLTVLRELLERILADNL